MVREPQVLIGMSGRLMANWHEEDSMVGKRRQIQIGQLKWAKYNNTEEEEEKEESKR